MLIDTVRFEPQTVVVSPEDTAKGQSPGKTTGKTTEATTDQTREGEILSSPDTQGGAGRTTSATEHSSAPPLAGLEQPKVPIPVSLTFHTDKSSGEQFIEVVDPETGEVLRQIPPEEMRRLAQAFGKLVGNVVDTLA